MAYFSSDIQSKRLKLTKKYNTFEPLVIESKFGHHDVVVVGIQLFRETLSERKHQSAHDKTERWSGYALEFCILA